MCNLSPLGRCIAHLSKEASQLEEDILSNKKSTVGLRKRIEKQSEGLTPEAQQKSAGLQMLRNQHEGLLKQGRILEQEQRENRLGTDATRDGMIALSKEEREGKPVESRQRHAEELNAWYKELKSQTDDNGNKMLSPDSDDKQRRIMYKEHHDIAKEEWHTASRDMAESEDSLKRAKMELNKLESLNQLSPSEKERLTKEVYAFSNKLDDAQNSQTLATIKLKAIKKAVATELRKKQQARDIMDGSLRLVEQKRRDVSPSQATEAFGKEALKLQEQVKILKANDTKEGNLTILSGLEERSKAVVMADGPSRLKGYLTKNGPGREADAMRSMRSYVARQIVRSTQNLNESTNKVDIASYRGHLAGYQAMKDIILGKN